jgi:hypothetical protein
LFNGCIFVVVIVVVIRADTGIDWLYKQSMRTIATQHIVVVTITIQQLKFQSSNIDPILLPDNKKGKYISAILGLNWKVSLHVSLYFNL